MSIPRPEYPRPQLVRDSWLNLNGEWTIHLDFRKSGVDRELMNSTGFERKITVPFAPESPLSGVNYKDFIEMMWYHRTISIPNDWSEKLVLLNFGAVDFECEVFVDGDLAGRHWGGSSSFTVNITRFIEAGSSYNLVVLVRDEFRNGTQTSGKQCSSFASRDCSYTRTTGIWQTVWLEAVDPRSLKQIHILPDVDKGGFLFIPQFWGIGPSTSMTIAISDGGRVVADGAAKASDGAGMFLQIENATMWQPGNPHLYDISITVKEDAKIIDHVSSYGGLRKVHIEGNKVLLNNEPIFQRLVLDQGFYPDGTWTAPTDDALKRDIELSMESGFNGARLHQKVFEERFHYWADVLGYLTWGESASWGLELNRIEPARNFLSEWGEIIVRDRNHPSIIAWTPFNETAEHADNPQHNRLHVDSYELCHALDPTRPVNDSSGYAHIRTDLWTVHNYEQDPEKLKEILSPTKDEGVFRNIPDHEAPYEGQPYIIDEFGGIKWNPDTQLDKSETQRKVSWGYGEPPASIEDFYRRLEGQVKAIRSLEHICGYCYTQLTDVEQEQNGVYYYDRSAKFDMKEIRRIFELEK